MALRFTTLALGLGLALLASPQAAPGHSIVRISGSEVTSLSADATSLNTLTARMRGGRIELRDPTVDGGMDIGPCEPGEVDRAGYIIQAFCPAQGITLLRIDAGDREDTVTAELAVPLLVLGGQGADTLRTGPAKDTVRGDGGDDSMTTGAGLTPPRAAPGSTVWTWARATMRRSCATGSRTSSAAGPAPTGSTPTRSTRSPRTASASSAPPRRRRPTMPRA
jgi:hypothetical protein